VPVHDPAPRGIAVDAMGGDRGPRIIVEGAVAAARELGVRLVLVGAAAPIQEHLRRLRAAALPIDVVEALEVIEMHEHPAMALRRKRGASIVVATEQVRQGRAAAVVSAGHTGAAMGAAQLVLGRVPGIERPAIAVVLPTAQGTPVVLLDVGANVDCRPHHLLQFGLMGSVYAREVLGIPAPRVGLVSNGEEETKGNDVTIRATGLLRGAPVRFVGNVEGRDVLLGAVDVAVCDGFVGNVLIKFAEGMALALRDIVRAELRGWRGRLLLLSLAPALRMAKRVWTRMDYREYGGAPLLGINGVCVVAHGRSGARAIRNAIRVAAEATAHDLPGRIGEAVRETLAPAAPGLGASR
jgi:glycerol-3-phosphate acyltransferase PlsX